MKLVITSMYFFNPKIFFFYGSNLKQHIIINEQNILLTCFLLLYSDTHAQAWSNFPDTREHTLQFAVSKWPSSEQSSSRFQKTVSSLSAKVLLQKLKDIIWAYNKL